MIEYTDLEARKQAAAQVMASFPDEPKERTEAGFRTFVSHFDKGDCDRTKLPHFGLWSVCKKGQRGWLWYANAWGHQVCKEWKAYGFAETEQQAITDAHQTIIEDFPNGFYFAWYAHHAATEAYSEHLAKRSWFSQDWRKRFPFWAERTHLYKYSEGEEKLRIVAVTPQSVFVYRPPFIVVEQVHASDMHKIQRRHCIVFDRATLERDGKAYHRKAGRTFYMEPQRFAHHDHSQIRRIRIEDLRRVMQKEHPDRGGNVELFRAAQEEYQQLKQSTKRGAA